MKKVITIFLILIGFYTTMGQEIPMEEEMDSISPEVVEVITIFNPKIADAIKIRTNPTIELSEKSKKQKLEFTIFSAPVASTFVPRSGVIKGIDVGIKERIYKNYIAAGYGSYNSPFLDVFLHHNTRFKNEFGVSANYVASQQNINNTLLNSNFSNFKLAAFYKQEDRYFDWKVSLLSEENKYNWYGLPSDIVNITTINSINEEQTYNYLKLIGDFKFIDSFIDDAKLSVAYFTDAFNSNEILVNLNSKLDFPLNYLDPNLNDISIYTGLELLTGEFQNNYQATTAVNYAIITFKVEPEYKMTYKKTILEAALKTYVSLDSENKATNLFLLPNFKIQRSLFKNHINMYGGLFSDLKTNTYHDFSTKNPFISPTQFITQTLEKQNIFVGFNGKITNNLVYNIKVSAINEEDKPMFLRNNSKSDGTTAISNGFQLFGYEYGNSFSVYYDDVKTSSIFAEIEYNFAENITLGTYLEYNNYQVTNALTNWNLPALEASIFGKYKNDKWFANSTIFYVSERNDVLYNGTFPSSVKGIQTVNSFVDINVNGGYHLNNKFSAFLNINNLLNNQYQRFANFNTQGFQILGGITYKFDF